MTKYETLFRKYFTKLWQLPFIIFPVLLVILYIYHLTGNYLFPLTILILLASTLLTSYIMGIVIKFLYYKPRPEPYHHKNRIQKIDASSFPSIHTANSMIIAFWWILSTLQAWTQTTTSYMVICGWFFFFMTISLSRVVLKKHFPIDVLAWVVFWTICIFIVTRNTDLILWVMDTILTWITAKLS